MRYFDIQIKLSDQVTKIASDDPSVEPAVLAYAVTVATEALRKAKETMSVISRSNLDLADEALANGCLDIADAYYRRKIFKPGKPEFIRRAQLGMHDVRDQRLSRNPKH